MKEKVWVEIDRKKLLQNLKQFKDKISKQTKLCCVIKSNAYGHGLEQITKISKKYADFFAVDSVAEALNVKEWGSSKSILILGYTLEDNLELVVKNGFHQVIANFQTLRKMSSLCKKLQKPGRVHLKIETGTSRQGIFKKDLNKFIVHIKSNPFLILSGVSTHYANIEDTTDHTYAFEQLEKYKQAIKTINKAGLTDIIKHTACSAATVLYPQTYFDLVRLGISMYGLWSSPETKAVAKKENIKLALNPCLTWKTRVAHIKILPKGSCVSYGCTEKVNRPTKVAVLPIGYWDGLDRGLSSLGNVLIHGSKCKIVGRVCMNMTVVDVNHLKNIKLEDEVVILGKQEAEEITAEEIANKIGTINYEVITRINPLIKRIIV